MLCDKLRAAARTAATEKLKLITEISRLRNELQQQSTATATEKKPMATEVVKLRDELREVTNSAAAEKQEMTKELQRLTTEMLMTTSSAMQMKLHVANTKNDRLAVEYQHALVRLESLQDECSTPNTQVSILSPAQVGDDLKSEWSLQLVEKPNGVERKLHDFTEITDSNIHELMDETRQLLECIEFKDHSNAFPHKLVRLFGLISAIPPKYV